MSSMNQPTSSDAVSMPDMLIESLGSSEVAAAIASWVQPCFGTCFNAARARRVLASFMESRLLVVVEFVGGLLLLFVVVADADRVVQFGSALLIACPLHSRSGILASLFIVL